MKIDSVRQFAPPPLPPQHTNPPVLCYCLDNITEATLNHSQLETIFSDPYPFCVSSPFYPRIPPPPPVYPPHQTIQLVTNTARIRPYYYPPLRWQLASCSGACLPKRGSSPQANLADQMMAKVDIWSARAVGWPGASWTTCRLLWARLDVPPPPRGKRGGEPQGQD